MALSLIDASHSTRAVNRDEFNVFDAVRACFRRNENTEMVNKVEIPCTDMENFCEWIHRAIALR
jgi:hypothetical protein